MDIQTRKIEFVQELLKLDSEELLTQLEELLYSENLFKKADFKPMSVTEFNNRIDQSINDSQNGKLTSTDDLILEIDKWV